MKKERCPFCSKKREQSSFARIYTKCNLHDKVVEIFSPRGKDVLYMPLSLLDAFITAVGRKCAICRKRHNVDWEAIHTCSAVCKRKLISKFEEDKHTLAELAEKKNKLGEIAPKFFGVQ